MAALQHYGALAQSCKACRQPGSEDLRKSWGCDNETPTPFYIADCLYCGGGVDNCPGACNDGLLEFRRCPNVVVPEEARRLCMYADLLAVGVLPVAGGLEQQAGGFAEALQIVQSVKNDLEGQQ